MCVLYEYLLNYRFKLPFGAEKYIPFYGGAEHHDYHHYIGGQSKSNFAPVFTYCDYIYGTDKVCSVVLSYINHMN
jgi:sterol desaturase/sphingolipid hydroxylase (fatty acid hydroxylase superfamily)